MKISVSRHNLSALSLLLALSGLAYAQEKPDYLTVVRGYADTMIEKGRDSYGEVKSPLFAATLDRSNFTVFDQPPPKPGGIRNHDRVLWGANPMHDQNLYQALYSLSLLTGDPKYGEEADKSLKFFFENCQSEQTGLLAWGEHLGWNFRKDQRIRQNHEDDTHEFYRPWVLWEKSHKLAPQSVDKFAQGLWKNQIFDHQTGQFSRHARFSEPGPEKNYEFPRHGGFFIETWADNYARTQNPEMLRAIETLVGYFERVRNPKTGALPAEGQTPELMWPGSNLSLAISLENAAPKVPEELRQKMRKLAQSTDVVFLKLGHEISKPNGRGFLKSAIASTLEPGDKTTRGTSNNGFYTRTWATGYGDSTDANYAMLCLQRFEQTQNEAYKTLFLAAAKRYVSSRPDENIELYPQAFAEAIAVMLGAHRLTKDAAYLESAEGLANRAIEIFWGDSPLPRASTRLAHYETITRADTLALQLLELWAVKNKPEAKLQATWSDR